MAPKQIVPLVKDVFEWNREFKAIRAYSRFDHWLSEEEYLSAFCSGSTISSLDEYEIVVGFELSYARFIDAINEKSPLHLIHATRGSVARSPIRFDELFHGYRKYKERSQLVHLFIPMYQLVLVLNYDWTILVFGTESEVLVEFDRAAKKAGLHTLPV